MLKIILSPRQLGLTPYRSYVEAVNDELHPHLSLKKLYEENISGFSKICRDVEEKIISQTPFQVSKEPDGSFSLHPSFQSHALNRHVVKRLKEEKMIEMSLNLLPGEMSLSSSIYSFCLDFFKRRLYRYILSRGVKIPWEHYVKNSRELFDAFHDGLHYLIYDRHHDIVEFFKSHSTPSPLWHEIFPSLMFESIVFYAQNAFSLSSPIVGLLNIATIDYIAYLIAEFYKKYPSYDTFFSRSNFTRYLLDCLRHVKQTPQFTQFKMRYINFLSSVAQVFFQYLQRPFLDTQSIHTLPINAEDKEKYFHLFDIDSPEQLEYLSDLLKYIILKTFDRSEEPIYEILNKEFLKVVRSIPLADVMQMETLFDYIRFARNILEKDMKIVNQHFRFLYP